MVSHHPAEFGSHKHCDSRGMTLLVNEGKDSTCPCLDWLLLFISKVDGMS